MIEHQGQCIYENGRFRLREETDYAIIDELEDFPPIMVQMEETDDGSEPQYADRRGVLHLMNQLADTNPNEQRHFYLKYRLDKVHNDNYVLRKENEQLKKENHIFRHFFEQVYHEYMVDKGADDVDLMKLSIAFETNDIKRILRFCIGETDKEKLKYYSQLYKVDLE